MHVRIKKAFSFENERGEKITAPRGWIGDLPDEQGKVALASGHAMHGDPRALPAAEDEGSKGGDNFDALTRPELEAIASERSIDVSKAKTKADVIEVLRAAR